MTIMQNTNALYAVFQFVTVTALVVGCALYCLLTLMADPIKRALQKYVPFFAPLQAISIRPVQTSAHSICSGHCGGCPSSAQASKTVQWYPRKPRS